MCGYRIATLICQCWLSNWQYVKDMDIHPQKMPWIFASASLNVWWWKGSPVNFLPDFPTKPSSSLNEKPSTDRRSVLDQAISWGVFGWLHQRSGSPSKCQNRCLIGWRICRARLCACRKTPRVRLRRNTENRPFLPGQARVVRVINHLMTLLMHY